MISSTTTPVLVLGAAGKMGQATVTTIVNDAQLQLVGAVDKHWAGQKVGDCLSVASDVMAQSSLGEALKAIELAPQTAVGIEFTNPNSVFANTMALIEASIAPLVGATGLTTDQLTTIDQALKQANLPGAVVPNFAIGAVLMMRFAKEASRYFDHAEVIELHHNRKLDAPSGTALHTVAGMAQAHGSEPFGPTNHPDEKEHLPGARGALAEGNVRVHSVRLPGLVAHQEVLLGAEGQLLTLKHDAFNRESFMPGVALAAKKLYHLPVGLTQGLDAFLDLV